MKRYLISDLLADISVIGTTFHTFAPEEEYVYGWFGEVGGDR